MPSTGSVLREATCVRRAPMICFDGYALPGGAWPVETSFSEPQRVAISSQGLEFSDGAPAWDFRILTGAGLHGLKLRRLIFPKYRFRPFSIFGTVIREGSAVLVIENAVLRVSEEGKEERLGRTMPDALTLLTTRRTIPAVALGEPGPDADQIRYARKDRGAGARPWQAEAVALHCFCGRGARAGCEALLALQLEEKPDLTRDSATRNGHAFPGPRW